MVAYTAAAISGVDSIATIVKPLWELRPRAANLVDGGRDRSRGPDLPPYTGCSDRVELPGDVVGNSPKIADFGLPDEGVGPPLVPPVQ